MVDAPATETPTEQTFSFEVADTTAEREQGLSGRESVPQDGMLFIFPEKGNYGFWMKDMLIPIDMIWIADDGTVVDVDRNVLPETYPKAFHPSEPVRYVLETEAGDADRRGWIEGAQVPLP